MHVIQQNTDMAAMSMKYTYMYWFCKKMFFITHQFVFKVDLNWSKNNNQDLPTYIELVKTMPECIYNPIFPWLYRYLWRISKFGELYPLRYFLLCCGSRVTRTFYSNRSQQSARHSLEKTRGKKACLINWIITKPPIGWSQWLGFLVSQEAQRS